MDRGSHDTLLLSVSTRSELSEKRAELGEWVRERAGDRVADDVLLACGEAIDNALEHGSPPVTVELLWDADGELKIAVRDNGDWTVTTNLPSRGLGLPIMTALMDNVTIDTTDGTAVLLTMRIPVGQEES